MEPSNYRERSPPAGALTWPNSRLIADWMCAAIDDKRPLRMIGDHPVVLEAEHAGLAFADQAAEGAGLGAATNR
jgi:hypothetical protein